MLRREFFRRVVGGVAAAVAAPFLPKPSSLKPALAFHRNAFALVMEPLLLDAEVIRVNSIDVSNRTMTVTRGNRCWANVANLKPHDTISLTGGTYYGNSGYGVSHDAS